MKRTFYGVAKHGSSFRVHFSDGNIRGVMQPYFAKEETAQEYARKLRELQPCLDIYDDYDLDQTIGRVPDALLQSKFFEGT